MTVVAASPFEPAALPAPASTPEMTVVPAEPVPVPPPCEPAGAPGEPADAAASAGLPWGLALQASTEPTERTQSNVKTWTWPRSTGGSFEASDMGDSF